jgi:hypothetical protein
MIISKTEKRGKQNLLGKGQRKADKGSERVERDTIGKVDCHATGTQFPVHNL